MEKRGRARPFVPPAPPKTRKSAATRDRLLAIAADLFVEQGYHAVSMRDVASKAGLTHGGIYGHFRSKGQLLVEVIRWRYAQRDRSSEFAAAVDDPDRSVRLLNDDTGRDLRLLEVDAAAAARHDDDVASGLASLYDERHAAIREAIGGDTSDTDAVAWVIAVIAGGIGMREAMRMQPPDADAFVATLGTMFDAVRDLPAPPSRRHRT